MASLALVWMVQGCGPAAPPSTAPATGSTEQPSTTGESSTGKPALAGTVVIDGSSTVYPISREAMLGFNKINPDVKVIVNKSGTSGGVGKYLENKLDIVDASRPANEKETAAAKAAGIDWLVFRIGYDGITVVVNFKNTFVKELTFDQLKKIWEKDSKVKTWKEADDAWPAQAISFHCPDKDSGTYDYFTEAIGTHKKQRDDVEPSSDDNKIVRGVSGDENGFGYFGYAYYATNAKSLRAIPIKKSADSPAVEPTPDSILDGTYPLARPLFLYVKKSAMRRLEVATFVKYYLDNAATLATDAGYVAPTASDDEANDKQVSPDSKRRRPTR